MAQQPLYCWRCDAELQGLPQPLGRRDDCPACGASLRACRMCAHFDRMASKACREPVAEEVVDKEAANFCDYFRARPGRWSAAGDRGAAESKARLAALFGEAAGAGVPTTGEAPAPPAAGESEAERARARLDALFGKPKP
ncbi:MAG: hypothetical protein HY423_11990 [Candidatus Lambdaproteobacteria bacterium]|nr:hypothetical protein [Candidatus Lambdaproteobacteria bacterium]